MPKLVGIVTSGYTLLGAVTWARDELVKHSPADSGWHVVDFLPHWTFWQWGFGAVVIVLLSVLETSFQRKKEADVVHGGEVGKLNNEMGRLGRQIGELEERLNEGPTVLLSNVGNGINLRVQSLRQDAINVRLVQAQTESYFLNSDVVRLLKVGSTESLMLHCHPREASGSRALQGFCSPTLFFNDTFPEPEGETVREKMEAALALLMEQQMVLLFEIAYSHLSGTHHYRSSFKARWDRMQETIVDVEPVETKIDRNSPTTAPPDVIPMQVAPRFSGVACRVQPVISEQLWRGESFLDRCEEYAERSRTNRKSVAARLEFIDSSGATQFTVPNAD